MVYYLRPSHRADFDMNQKNMMLYGIPLLVAVLVIAYCRSKKPSMCLSKDKDKDGKPKCCMYRVIALAVVLAIVTHYIMKSVEPSM